ncbi:phytanoyl-CoA dioxygenase family protein [Streptomyces sudanensis]|uniref:phytanoyl-CoA dioxygenase family protein n=1 Tax=Streptomyces sudanensis TaxID=436397 RepID=UPI0035584B24
MEDQELRKKFAEDGYIVVRGGLTEDLVAHVTREIGGLLRGLDAPQRRAFPFQGSMVPASPLREPWSRLIADEAILGTLRRLGAADLRWLSGYLISKPPRSPRLWWHQDWWAWKDELSFADMPPQISVLTYPAGSSTESGCLRVIPGSHRRRHRLHSVLPPRTPRRSTGFRPITPRSRTRRTRSESPWHRMISSSATCGSCIPRTRTPPPGSDRVSSFGTCPTTGAFLPHSGRTTP